MEYEYTTKGTCSQKINFNINDGVVTNIKFTGGCDGNLKALSAVMDGWTAEQIASKCKGIKCGWKNTSCSDQLATAVMEAKAKAD